MADQQPLRRSVVNYRGQLELPKKAWLACRAVLGIHWRTEFTLFTWITPLAWKKSKQAQIQRKQVRDRELQRFIKVFTVRGIQYE